MALTVTAIGNNNSTSADNSLVITTTAAVPAGAMIALFIATANSGTGGASPGATVTDSDTNTYTQRSDVTYDPGTGSQGSTLIIFTAAPSSELASGDTITITFGTNTGQKAAYAFKVVPGAGETVAFDSVDASGLTGNTNTYSAPTVSVTSGHVIFGAASVETDDAFTGDTDTDNGSWSTIVTELADAGADAASETIAVQYKVVTGTGDQAWACTTTNSYDSARNYMILSVSSGGTDDLTATGIATDAPTTGTPAITQTHVLTATGIATDAPTTGTPAITQTHVLTATGIATDAPTVGTPSMFNRPTVPNIVLWLEGDNNEVYEAVSDPAEDGDQVTTWVDVTNGVTGTGNGTSTKPFFETNTVNGYPAMYSAGTSGSGGWLFDLASPTLTAWSMYFVIRPDAGAFSATRYIAGDESGVAGFGWESGNFTVRTDGGGAPDFTGAVTTEAWHVISLIYDGTDLSLFIDGVEHGESPQTVAGQAFTYTASVRANDQTRRLPGFEAARIVASSAHNDTDRLEVEAYLLAKYLSTHALTAVGIATDAPTTGTPTLAEAHVLAADGIRTGNPTVGSPILGQKHALTATGIATDAPTTGTPTLGQVHALTATGIATGAPTTGTPTLAESAPAPGGPESGYHTLVFEYYDGINEDWVTINQSEAVFFSGNDMRYYVKGAVPVSTQYLHGTDSMRIQFAVTTLPSAGAIVVQFRHQDADNHWYVSIANDGHARLYQVFATAVELRELTGAGAVSNGSVFDLLCYGTNIDAYVDGSIIFDHASGGSFSDEDNGYVSSLGTGGVITSLSTWDYVADYPFEYDTIELGGFQGGLHIWTGVPPSGTHDCTDGVGHPSNVKYMSTNTMSINGGAETAINDTNLSHLHCFRMYLTVSPASTPSNCRFYCYDGDDVTKRAPGVEAYAFERGAAVGHWTLINSGESSVGGDNFGERLELQDKTGNATEHVWHIAVSASPEYPGGLNPHFGARVLWS